MKIIITHGGDIKISTSHEVAKAIHADYSNVRMPQHEVVMYEVDAEGEIYEHKIKSNWHRLLSKTDILIDTTYSHSKRNVVHELAKKMGVKVYFDNDIDLIHLRRIMKQVGLAHPKSYVVSRDYNNLNKEIHELWRKVHLPVMIRSSRRSVPSLLTHSPHELKDHIIKIHKSAGHEAIIDEYLTGDMYTILLVKNYRGERVWSTPIIKIYKNLTHSNSHVKYAIAKDINEINKNKINIAIKELSKHVDHDLISVDFILDKNGQVNIISVKNKLQYYPGQMAFDIMKDWGVSMRDVIKI